MLSVSFTSPRYILRSRSILTRAATRRDPKWIFWEKTRADVFIIRSGVWTHELWWTGSSFRSRTELQLENNSADAGIVRARELEVAMINCTSAARRVIYGTNSRTMKTRRRVYMRGPFSPALLYREFHPFHPLCIRDSPSLSLPLVFRELSDCRSFSPVAREEKRKSIWR